MSKHEALNNQPDNEQFNNELAAFDNTFEEYGVVPTNKHEQTDTTDPSNHANAIIDRIKSERTQQKPYSIEDSYNKTLDGVNSVVNENISPDQQFENEMAAFDNILGEYEAQEASNPSAADFKEAKTPREFTAPSPTDAKDTTAIPIANEKSVDTPTLVGNDQEKIPAGKYVDGWDVNDDLKHFTVGDMLELQKRNNGFEPTDSEEDHDEKFMKNAREFAGLKQPTEQLANSLRGILAEARQDAVESNSGSRSSKEIAAALKDVADKANEYGGGDTRPLPTSPETRKKAEAKYKKDAAKLRKGGRKSYKDSFLEGFRKGLDSTQDRSSRIKKTSVGRVTRQWAQYSDQKSQLAPYKEFGHVNSLNPFKKSN
jgi:hypothetical protein